MDITVTCPIEKSFRVSQIAGMFDVPLEKKTTLTFQYESPPLSEPWKIGLIVGPSGSGKSTVASQLFCNNIYRAGNWSDKQAVIDGFGDEPIKEIVAQLTMVGFSSPPSWMKPYPVLSNGERFRCDLAKATMLTGQVAFDEYTSVVDRDVAKIASAAIAKAAKSNRLRCQFVAVTCHYDIMEWLEPDWVLDMANGTVSRRRLRRPTIELQIVRCRKSAWTLFAKHHYLNGNLGIVCECYVALWLQKPIAFCAMIPQMGRKNHWRVSRIVTLPDYQGMGIGSTFLQAIALMYKKNGKKVSITASHPSILSHCAKSPNWKTTNVQKIGSASIHHKNSRNRAVVSFAFQPTDG